ncbi:hypothetical protein BCR44DRAFT_23518 [Catenaria anguillulae PL171]|uniref:Uncharacterized protein n=1 Tax=Catenaria anguillulae PL171 TaxID=765915 RepID=A0A1Y2HMY8_9FUNG|nr:hypothetical protein BCR44DRAFT_23518 [Catenaria anguillulae PL171]
MASTSATIPPSNAPIVTGAHNASAPGPTLSNRSSHHSIISTSSQSAQQHIQGNASNPGTSANTSRHQRKMKAARDNSTELNRIQVERIWADRIEKELQMQRAFPANWGFLVGKAAVQGTTASSRRPEQEAFTVKSVLHPPTGVPRTHSTIPTSARPATSASKRAVSSSQPATAVIHINQHTNSHTHHLQSVYKSAYTPAVFTFQGGGSGSQNALPDRFAALPNKKELRQATRTIAIQQRQQAQQQPAAHVPPTSNSEYGWRFPGTLPLERYGSTSANHRQAYAQVSRRDGGLLPAARKPKAGSHGTFPACCISHTISVPLVGVHPKR